MSERAEALAQLARLLGDESLRTATAEAALAAARRTSLRLAQGIVAEAAASDDVSDAESALAYAEMRLDYLALLIDKPLTDQLRVEIRHEIEKW